MTSHEEQAKHPERGGVDLTALLAALDALRRCEAGAASMPVPLEGAGVRLAEAVNAVAAEQQRLVAALEEAERRRSEQEWLHTHLARITRLLQGQRDLRELARTLLSQLVPLIGGQCAVLYLLEGEGPAAELGLLASWALLDRGRSPRRFRPGEGLVGQCALERRTIHLTDLPPGYLQVGSGLGEATPASLVLLPVLFEGELLAVLEVASFRPFTPLCLSFLERLSEGLAIVLNTTSATQRTEKLLAQSQALTDELRAQQEELTATNRRLEQQAETMRRSEELLKRQQGELQAANEQLEARAHLLSEQKEEVERKNREVEQARQMLEEKAAQLALTSKYKSDFLANMSHEVRTPLNSLLILARLLAENPEGNLSPREVEFAHTIYSSGNDLLELINDILDLAKVESGTITLELEEIRFSDLRAFAQRTFGQVARSKGLALEVELDPALPPALRTDGKRLQQVLRNLLANAVKFTDQGRVCLRMFQAHEGWSPVQETLRRAEAVVGFQVVDTGIGIPADKHRIVFEAFQQADGGTSRKYGGTGLGLSISRELVQVLGGEIALESTPGQGSTFTVYLPIACREAPRPRQARPDDTNTGRPRSRPYKRVEVAPQPALPLPAAGERVVLVVGRDQERWRALLAGLEARGLHGRLAASAAEALTLVKNHLPAAVVLDLDLPAQEGWLLLDRLKHDPATRHLPVHACVASQVLRARARRSGARSVCEGAPGQAVQQLLEALDASLTPRRRRLLLLHGDQARRAELARLLADEDLAVHDVGDVAGALEALGQGPVDCLVLPTRLGGEEWTAALDRLRAGSRGLATQGGASGPGEAVVLLYLDAPLSEEQAARLSAREEVVVAAGPGPERLLAETVLHLDRDPARLGPERQRALGKAAQAPDAQLLGRHVLIVDDDVRNIFSLATVLERRGIAVLHAETGREAIALLRRAARIDAVLMDIMLPEMDGCQAIQAIRGEARFQSLPIFALTAKAMPQDREECLAAGASEYLSKPVDIEQLLTLLRVWLGRPTRLPGGAEGGANGATRGAAAGVATLGEHPPGR